MVHLTADEMTINQYIDVFSSPIYSPRIESVTVTLSHKFGSTGYI